MSAGLSTPHANFARVSGQENKQLAKVRISVSKQTNMSNFGEREISAARTGGGMPWPRPAWGRLGQPALRVAA
jgi:hypothetical protein